MADQFNYFVIVRIVCLSILLLLSTTHYTLGCHTVYRCKTLCVIAMTIIWSLCPIHIAHRPSIDQLIGVFINERQLMTMAQEALHIQWTT